LSAAQPRGGILAGLRVVELSAFVAAPLGGSTLAELGAEVVRIDPPGGGIDANRWPLHQGRSLYWAGLNQGKRSAGIDTSTAAGRELATALIAAAGTVVTNLPVRGWNSYDALKRRRRDLIMAVLSGNPDGSPAVDYTVNAAVGFPWVTGPAGLEGPVNHVLPAWDALAGWALVAGVLAAELHRTRTGEGQLLTLSLMDMALSVVSHLGFIAEAQLSPEPRPRLGNDLYGTYSRDFRTADGRSVIVVALTPRQWAGLVQATGIGAAVAELEARHGVDLRDEGARYELRHEISRLVDSWISARPYAEVGRELDANGVLWGPYQTFQELAAVDPRCSPANPVLQTVDQPGIGEYLRAGSPLSFSGADRLPPPAAPTLGADTAAVLRDWLGLGDDDLGGLAAAGAIAGT
jgi:2-methylfumaryl-CoA isomerase